MSYYNGGERFFEYALELFQEPDMLSPQIRFLQIIPLNDLFTLIVSRNCLFRRISENYCAYLTTFLVYSHSIIAHSFL